MVVDYVLAMWMDGFQGHFQKSFLTFYVLEKLDYRSDPFNTLIPYMSNVYSIQIIYIYIVYTVYRLHMHMGYGIVHNTLLRNMTRSFHFHIPCIQPGQGGSGTATVERWSGGASRVDTTRLEPKMGKGDEMGTDHFFQGMPWDTTVICDQIIGIPWDIDGYS